MTACRDHNGYQIPPAARGPPRGPDGRAAGGEKHGMTIF